MRKSRNWLGTTAIGLFAGALMVGPVLAAPVSDTTPTTQSNSMNEAKAPSMKAPAANAPIPKADRASSPFAAGKGTKNSMAAAEPLTHVAKPKTALASAKVEDSSGSTVGTVSGVTTESSGKAKTVKVSLSGTGDKGKDVAIEASKLRYSPTSHTLKAKLTGAEIRAMPKVQDTTQNP